MSAKPPVSSTDPTGSSGFARKALLGLAALAVLGAVLWLGAPQDVESPALPDRIVEARLSGQPVLVEFGAGHCAACLEMKGFCPGLRPATATRW